MDAIVFGRVFVIVGRSFAALLVVKMRKMFDFPFGRNHLLGGTGRLLRWRVDFRIDQIGGCIDARYFLVISGVFGCRFVRVVIPGVIGEPMRR